ncbi:type VI secretion system contractile sheath large subunit [Escherichia coli]|nr:type VI secretion system contractile sheath large subunit [Escherichia coli]EFI5871964.1 type VI secretion system contractile sheath large subunit [Escherichia coli]EIP6335115.1 type VI secretion system contractile sheath large subunit [Escherichia coli]MBI1433709.1 type VI secretion system contractile sheath large subunit [Escherichia coli]MBI1443295.1 type VI secretion system contractile sheath large subunit [Escherichia coli]MBI1459172.1 type VI secretion system contractile sheath large 
MSVQQEHATSETATLTTTESGGVYQSLFDKINLTPVSSIQEIDLWQNSETLADASPDERVTAAIHVLLSCLAKSGENVVKLDKSLLDFHIDDLDQKISKQLDAVMHHPEFQKVESLWRGTWFVVQRTDFRKNVRIELLDISKEHLRQDFDDSPEIIQSGLYRHTYIQEYDTPGGEPVASLISSYEFDNSPQDIALLRNISRVSAASHMPFIGSVGPKFFLKNSMEEVAAIKDIGNYFDRAEYIKWKSFRDTDDSRYVGLVMPRVLGRLPYGPDTVPVRSFNYVEEVKGPDHEKYLWTNASFAFAANMVKSFVNNGWCVQIRGPQAGGAVADLPIHLYDLGTGNQVKIPSEVMIPETREFEFSNLGFIPLSYYKNRDYACFFSANSAQKPALYDTADATANSRINARLPYIFLLSRIAHYLKIIQRENIGTTKDRRVLELELNTWIRTLVTEMTDPGDELQASHPLRDGKVNAHDGLVQRLDTLLLQLRAKCQRLMAMRRESNQRMADFAVADVSLFWLLNALNSAEPVLSDFLRYPAVHPELVWRELARLAGALLTFSLEHNVSAVPPYVHESPSTVFPPLFSLLSELLEASLPSRVIALDLESLPGNRWKADLHDPRLREEADFYLSVRSSLPAHQVLHQLPLVCKIGAPDDVTLLINVALNGVPLVPLTSVPAALPLRLENQYFALDMHSDAAKSMLESGCCMIYAPGTMGDLKPELFAVLRT